MTLSPFRMNTYEKQGEGGQLWLTSYPTRIAVLRSIAAKDLASYLPRFLRLRRNSGQAGQWRSSHALSLHKQLESFAHALRMDQRLQLQPRFGPLRLGLPLVVEVGKLISLPERHQESRLRGRPRRLQA